MVTLNLNEPDSGMESLSESSKNLTPEKVIALDDDFENEDDETLVERLLGLTEIFPESIRNVTYTGVCGCTQGINGLFRFSKSAAWILFSTGVVLFAPLLFEIERVQFQNAQLSQQKQVLLGPSSAVSAGGSMGPGMPMPPPR